MSGKNFILSVAAVVALSSCGSGAKKEPCPTVEEEAVSTCRAIEKCRDERSGDGAGVGAGSNFGIGISQSQSTEAYTSCVAGDLKAQENKKYNENENEGSAGSGQPGQKPGLMQ